MNGLIGVDLLAARKPRLLRRNLPENTLRAKRGQGSVRGRTITREERKLAKDL
jgi:hypothetical protein